MGLAPLLGFLLDALLGGTRLDDVVEAQVQRLARRAQFVVQRAFGGPTVAAGRALAIWVGGAAIVVAWGLSTAGYVVQQEYGVFFVRSLLFLLLFTARRQTARSIEALIAIASEDRDAARLAVRRLGRATDADDPDALQGSLVQAMGVSTLGAVLVPVFWGFLGGSTLAAGALAVHVLASMRPLGPQGANDQWETLDRIDGWVSLPAAWLGALIYPAVLTTVGGRRTPAFAGFASSPRLTPKERLAKALERGFALPEREDDGAVIASSSHVQRAVQGLFVGGFVCVTAMAAMSAVLHHLM